LRLSVLGSMSVSSIHHCVGVDASVTGVAGAAPVVSVPTRSRTRRNHNTYMNMPTGRNLPKNRNHRNYRNSEWRWLETIDRRGGATTTSKSTATTTTTTSATMDGLKSSLASALAAGCSKTLLAPFDTLKTIQQHYRAASGTSLTFWQAVKLVMERPNGIREFYVSACQVDWKLGTACVLSCLSLFYSWCVW
jgi:hypothetical protein